MNLLRSIKRIIKKILTNIKDVENYNTRYKIEGVIKDKKVLLFVLAGYKSFLWNDIFERIKRNQLEDMEICVASSGKYCAELSKICKKNGWIYLSTKLNNVCVVTNVIMRQFSQAEYIFKLDEDIYIPDGYFKDMLEAYKNIEKQEACDIGYICPVLPLGFYGMHDFLIRNNCLEEYENRFGPHKRGGSRVNPAFRKKVGVDEFIWEKIMNFDNCAALYKQDGFSYEACFARTGIAAILYTKRFWNDFGCFKRGRGIGVGEMGDEGQITTFCILNFYLVFCVKNILVGHFAFGGAEDAVLELKQLKPEIFSIKKSL